MEPEETMEVPSEETVEQTVETPSEQPTEVPAEQESAQPAEPKEPELYELPDGRKVTGVEVAQEYKNLLSDYTKKAQTLSEIEKAKTINQPTEKPYANPEFEPKDWSEVITLAKQEALQEIEAKEQAKIEERQARESVAVAQLNDIKNAYTDALGNKVAANPTLNSDALFAHAVKYGFRDLKLAHQNMRDMSEQMKKVQKTTADNITKRKDPVSITPGGAGSGKPSPSMFGSAVEYLRSLQQ